MTTKVNHDTAMETKKVLTSINVCLFCINLVNNFMLKCSDFQGYFHYRCTSLPAYQALNYIAQKMKFSVKDFYSNCDKIRRKLRIWSNGKLYFLWSATVKLIANLTTEASWNAKRRIYWRYLGSKRQWNKSTDKKNSLSKECVSEKKKLWHRRKTLRKNQRTKPDEK